MGNVLQILFFVWSNRDKFAAMAEQLKEFVEWIVATYNDNNDDRVIMGTENDSYKLDAIAAKFPSIAEACEAAEVQPMRTNASRFAGRRGVLGDLIRKILEDPERAIEIVKMIVDLFKTFQEPQPVAAEAVVDLSNDDADEFDPEETADFEE